MAEKKVKNEKKTTKDMTLINVISAYIEQIVEIQTVVDRAKIDNKTIKKMTKTLKQSVEVLKVISENKELIQAIIQNPIKGDAAKKFDALCNVVKSLGDIAESLKKVGVLAIPIILMKPLISKVIGIIIEINDQLSQSKKQANPKTIEGLIDGLVAFGKGLLSFLTVTAFGIVPLAAIVSLLAVRSFLWVMEKTFTGKSLEQLIETSKGLREVAAALLLLAGTVIVLVLTGELIRQGWKQMLMVSAYFGLVTLAFIAISFVFKYTQREGSTEQIREIAIALLLISASAVVMILAGELISQGWKQMLMVMAYLAFVTLMFAAVSFATKLMSSEGSTKQIREIAIALLLISASAAIMILTGELVSQGWKQMLVVMAYLAAVTLVFLGISLLFQFISKEGSTKQIMRIAIALALISLTAIILIMAGEFITQGWKQMLIVTAYVVLVTGIFILVGALSELIDKGAKEMLWIALATSIISLTAILLITVGQQIQANWVQLLLVAAFVTIVTGMFVAVGALSELIDPGVVGFLLISAALIVFSISLMLLHATTSKMTWEEVGIISALIGAVSLIGTLLGATMPLPLLGAVALFALGDALLFFAAPIAILAKSIETLKNIKATGEDMAKPIHLVGALVGAVLSEFGGIKGLWRLGKAVTRMMMLIPIATSVGIISRVIASIASLNMPVAFDEKGNPTKFQRMTAKDFTEAATNAAGVASTLANLFGDGDYEVNIGGQKVTIHPITEKMLENITRTTVRKMSRLTYIAACIGSMAKVLQKMASLNMPDDAAGFDKNGNPKGYKRMKSEDFIEAATNAAGIASTLANLFGDEPFVVRVGGKDVKITPVSRDVLDNITWSVKWKMNRLAGIVGTIGIMASTLQNLASLIIPDSEAGFDKDGKPKGYKTMKTEDFVLAAANTAKIATTLLNGITYYKDPTTGKSTMDLIDDMSYWALIKLDKAMSILGNVSGMVEAVQQMASMNVPTAWDKNGKPTAFRTLTEKERERAIVNTTDMVCFFLKALTEDDITEALNSMGRRARKNIETVMNSTSGVVALVDAVTKATELDSATIATGIANLKECVLRYAGLINELFVDVWEWKWGKKKILGINVPWLFHEKVREAEIDMRAMNTAVDRMQVIVDTMEPLNNLINSIKSISNEDNTKGVNTGVENLGKVVRAYCEIFTGNDKGEGGVNITPVGEKKFAAFKQIVQYHDYFAKINSKNLKTNTDNFVRFIDKANQLDADKIVKQTDMWNAMTEFMQSMKDLPFEELADAIVNKIAPAMTDISDNVDKMSGAEPQATSITRPSGSAPQGQAIGDPTTSRVNNAPGVDQKPIDYSDVLEAIKRSVEEILQQKMMGG